MTAYNYTKNLVAIDKLEKEIQLSAITIALDYIQTYELSLSIVFKASLSNDEITILDAIVTAHDGIHLVENEHPTTVDKRPIVSASPRPLGTYTFFSSAGDKQTDMLEVSHGDRIKFWHTSGDGSGEHTPIYFKINTISNKTYLHGGLIQWKGAKFDEIEVEVVSASSADAITSGTNTFYEVVSGMLIMAAGTGTKVIDWSKVVLVEMVEDEYGVIPTAFWDATFNNSTKAFENITFNSQGKGVYNIFAQETELNCFIPKFIMLGDGLYELGSQDVSRLGQNMYIKIMPETITDDHDWGFTALINMYRERTF